MRPCFAIYTLMLIVQISGVDVHAEQWGRRWWLHMEPLCVLACCASVLEAFWWATDRLPTKARSLLISGLLGVAVAMAALVFEAKLSMPNTSGDTLVWHVITSVRLLLHGGLFGMMAAGLTFALLMPFPIERWSGCHYVLLMFWLGLRILSTNHPRNWWYQPTVAGLYLIWTGITLFRPPVPCRAVYLFAHSQPATSLDQKDDHYDFSVWLK